jgi:hypothetical protein
MKCLGPGMSIIPVPEGYGVIGNPTHMGLYQAPRLSLVAQGRDLQTVPYGTDLHAALSQALRAWLPSRSPSGTSLRALHREPNLIFGGWSRAPQNTRIKH